LWGFGSNKQGQLGLGAASGFSVPTQIGIDSDWTDFLSNGAYHTILNQSTSLQGFGNNVREKIKGTPRIHKTPFYLGVMPGGG